MGAVKTEQADTAAGQRTCTADSRAAAGSFTGMLPETAAGRRQATGEILLRISSTEAVQAQTPQETEEAEQTAGPEAEMQAQQAGGIPPA